MQTSSDLDEKIKIFFQRIFIFSDPLNLERKKKDCLKFIIYILSLKPLPSVGFELSIWVKKKRMAMFNVCTHKKKNEVSKGQLFP